MKIRNKNKNFDLKNDKEIEDNNADGYSAIWAIIGYTFLIVLRLFENKLSDGYIKANRSLFGIGIIIIFYLIFLSFYGINFIKDFWKIIILIFNKDFNFSNNAERSDLLLLILYIEIVLVFVFIIDWNLFWGYTFQVSAVIAVLVINQLIIMTKKLLGYQKNKN